MDIGLCSLSHSLPFIPIVVPDLHAFTLQIDVESSAHYFQFQINDVNDIAHRYLSIQLSPPRNSCASTRFRAGTNVSKGCMAPPQTQTDIAFEQKGISSTSVSVITCHLPFDLDGPAALSNP